MPLQLHVADSDVYEPADAVADWLDVALRRGIAAQVFRYPALVWKRAVAFLADL